MAAKLTATQQKALAMIRGAYSASVVGAVVTCYSEGGLDKRGNRCARVGRVAMRTVRALEKRGLVETRWVASPMGGGDLKVFATKEEV